mmetsp:Transcript_23217/g.57285  ORF Transcript_23217/g.57285 Transcript_23217/m.57285 type:complete len:219 (-) Transcript_23217:200-856(-)
MILRLTPTFLAMFFRKLGPFAARLKAAVHTPPISSAPSSLALAAKRVMMSDRSSSAPSLNLSPWERSKSSARRQFSLLLASVLITRGTTPACRSISATTILTAPDPTSKAARRSTRRPARSFQSRSLTTSSLIAITSSSRRRSPSSSLCTSCSAAVRHAVGATAAPLVPEASCSSTPTSSSKPQRRPMQAGPSVCMSARAGPVVVRGVGSCLLISCPG